MNVYDFDKTIYRRDSSSAFYLWCLRRYPRMARRWPRIALAFCRYKTGALTRATLMETVFEYLRDVPDVPGEVERFWDDQISQIHAWYLRVRRPDDLIISASPAFLVRPAARRLRVQRVLASPLNPVSGLYEGERCHGEGKVRAFLSAYPHMKIEDFYSDSLSDAPLADLSARAHMVHGETLKDWPQVR